MPDAGRRARLCGRGTRRRGFETWGRPAPTLCEQKSEAVRSSYSLNAACLICVYSSIEYSDMSLP